MQIRITFGRQSWDSPMPWDLLKYETKVRKFNLIQKIKQLFQTKVDKLTLGVLVRENDPLKEDITLSTEGKTVFKSKYEIIITINF